MDLSIVTVNWNSVEYLRKCIRSIYENTHDISFEIVVVDNASPEGRVDTLRDDFPEIQIVQSATNGGFARANNLGFRHTKGDCVLFLNPDTLLVGPAINIMLGYLRALPSAGIFGCKLLNEDLSVSTTSIQQFPTILNQLANIEYFRLRWPGCPLWNLSPLFCDPAGAVNVQVIPGACMMLRREVFESAGMFSEDFFMYGEDLDLNYKVSALGLKNYYVGEARVIHYGGKSSSQQKVSSWATTMKYRSMLRLFVKTRGRFYGAAYRMVMGGSAVVRLLILGLMRPFGAGAAAQSAAEKWSVVLRWSIGLQNSRFEGQ